MCDVLCVYFIVYFQNVELCSTCYEKYGHEHAMRKFSADMESRAAAKSIDSSSDVIQRCIETVAHAAACTQGKACLRQPECRKMMDVLRHARACTLRTTCTVCQQLMALCVTHARACTIDSSACHVPFCAELRRHIQRRQTLQRHQQHQMDDRRRALMTGTSVGNEDLIQVNDITEEEPNDGNAGQRCAGKGGDWPEQSISGDVSATNSTSANVTKEQEPMATNGDALSHNGCSVFPDVADNSTVSSELKLSSYSISQTNGCLTVETTSTSGNLHYPPVPKSAAASLSDVQLVENRSASDLPTSEVLHTTESSARHQIVIGCLRVLKKLNPSMSKQNLLQLLCHCSRQQLTALQDKVSRFFVKF